MQFVLHLIVFHKGMTSVFCKLYYLCFNASISYKYKYDVDEKHYVNFAAYEYYYKISGTINL